MWAQFFFVMAVGASTGESVLDCSRMAGSVFSAIAVGASISLESNSSIVFVFAILLLSPPITFAVSVVITLQEILIVSPKGVIEPVTMASTPAI